MTTAESIHLEGCKDDDSEHNRNESVEDIPGVGGQPVTGRMNTTQELKMLHLQLCTYKAKHENLTDSLLETFFSFSSTGTTTKLEIMEAKANTTKNPTINPIAKSLPETALLTYRQMNDTAM